MIIDALDLHPAAVTIGSVRYPKARVLLQSSRLLVLVNLTGAPQLVLAADVAGAERARGRMYQILLQDGRTVDIRRGSGCGCNSPLKNMTVGQILALDVT